MRSLFYIVTAFLLYGGIQAQETSMTPSEILQFKEKVGIISKSTKTIQSDFTQYKHMDFLSNDIETFGKMSFKAPNLVKWEYTKPYVYSVIFDNDKLYINDDGSKSDVDLGNTKLFKKINELIVGSVKGDMFNDTDFEISYLKTRTHHKVTFVPKDERIAGYIVSFVLLFDNSEATVEEVRINEPSGDYTQIIFQNRTLNQPLSDAVFVH